MIRKTPTLFKQYCCALPLSPGKPKTSPQCYLFSLFCLLVGYQRTLESVCRSAGPCRRNVTSFLYNYSLGVRSLFVQSDFPGIEIISGGRAALLTPGIAFVPRGPRLRVKYVTRFPAAGILTPSYLNRASPRKPEILANQGLLISLSITTRQS